MFLKGEKEERRFLKMGKGKKILRGGTKKKRIF